MSSFLLRSDNTRKRTCLIEETNKKGAKSQNWYMYHHDVRIIEVFNTGQCLVIFNSLYMPLLNYQDVDVYANLSHRHRRHSTFPSLSGSEFWLSM